VADANTTRYGFTKPEVGASSDTWGGKLNTGLDDIDALLGAFVLTGSSSAYVLTTGLSLAAYVAKQRFLVQWNHTNASTSPTLNVDGLGAKSIKKRDGSTSPSASDLVSGRWNEVVYDGSNLVVLNLLPSDYQPLDADLTAIAALGYTSGSYVITKTAADTWALNAITAAGLALLDDADASAQRTTLGLGTAATQNTGTSGANVPLLNGANAWSNQQTVTYSAGTAHALAAVNTNDSATVYAARIAGQRATPANNDAALIDLRLANASGTLTQFGRLGILANAVTAGAEDGQIVIWLASAGTVSTVYRFNPTSFRPAVSDTVDFGSSTVPWRNAYFASGRWLDWGNNNVRLTHASALLTLSGGQFAAAALGSAATPDYTFAGDTDTGLRRTGANAGALVAGGADVAAWDSAGLKDASGNLLQAGGKHMLPLPAAAWRAQTSNGAASYSAELTTNKQMVSGWAFDKDASEYIQCWLPMPKSWNEGTFTARIRWYAPSGAGNVVWAVQALCVGNDDALDAAWGTAQSVTDALTATGDLMVTAETSAITAAGSPAEADSLLLRVYRDAANGSDTLSADAILLSVELFPVISGANDA